MFTGIIRATTPILSLQTHDENLHARIATPKDWQLTEGQSIAIDGVCSTVTTLTPEWFEVVWMPETLAKTTVGFFKEGGLVNLERSLTLSDFVDGHLVQGHVDSRATVSNIEVSRDGGTRVSIEIPEHLARFVAQKGSIAINGVSLTVADKHDTTATVALIPYTLEHTTLGLLKEEDLVNVEVDMVARYISALNK